MTSAAQRRISIPDAHCRLRIEVPRLYDDPSFAEEIANAMVNIAEIVEIGPNPRTGRVLVVLSADDEIVAETVRARLQEISGTTATSPPSIRRMARALCTKARRGIVALRKAYENRENGSPSESRSNDTPWHAMDVKNVLQHFRVDPENGLEFGRVETIRRLAGRNVLAGIEPRSSFDILGDQIFTVPSALLFAAAGLSMALGDVIEASAIVLVVGCNVAVGYFSEKRAEELLNAWSELRAEWATVLRNGQEMLVAAADVVPGDVLFVRAGDAIAADASVIDAHDLTVDESMLTGESEPAEKNTEMVAERAPVADRHGMLYAGTSIATGTGRAIVVAIGEQTELGAIQRALSQAEERIAPLQQQLDGLGKRIAAAAGASSVAVILLGLIRGQPLSILLRSAVALGVAAIPEGFPAVGTTALALASRRLHRKGIVIRKLAAAETLGAVRIVCADKTGTLTMNRMRVQEVYVPERGLLRVEWNEDQRLHLETPDGQFVNISELHDLARIAALNADVTFDDQGSVAKGSGTERALVEFAMALLYPAKQRRETVGRIREERRTPERQYMITEHDHPSLGRIRLVKGAPEQVVPFSTNLSQAERQNILSHNDVMASRGLRVLALSWRKGADETTDPHFVFAGLVGLEDPPRPGIREAMSVLSRAGITTLMLTGDQRKTALAVGRALGIEEKHVYSRVTPAAKLDVVQELQNAGNIVAMTGDGVNDGPALKAADVGIAMGKRGTDIARAVADVVLAQDDLPAIASAIAEGRCLHDNVRRAIHYLSATNMSEVLAMLFGASVGITPLGPLQLLWINILTDVAPALALAVEPPEGDVMQRLPRNPMDPLFSTNELRDISRHAALMAGCSLAAYGIGAIGGAGVAGARSMSFLSLVTSQLLYTRNCQARSGQTNPTLKSAIAGSFALQAAAFGIAPLRSLLGIQPLGVVAMGTSVILGFFPGWIATTRTASATDSVITFERISASSRKNPS